MLPYGRGISAMKTNRPVLCIILSAVLLCGCGARPEVKEPVPSAVPAGSPTDTPAPTAAPTAAPTDKPAPTPIPTPVPTPTPTAVPTLTPIPTPAPTPDGPTAPPAKPGKYTYSGPDGKWILALRDDGLFVLTDPKGFQHPGESWITEADGTVTCGPTDIYDAEFAFAQGCSRWTITGKTCKPVMP